MAISVYKKLLKSIPKGVCPDELKTTPERVASCDYYRLENRIYEALGWGLLYKYVQPRGIDREQIARIEKMAKWYGDNRATLLFMGSTRACKISSIFLSEVLNETENLC